MTDQVKEPQPRPDQGSNVDGAVQPASGPFLARVVRNSVFSGLGSVSTFILGFLFAGLSIRYLGEARGGYLMTIQALVGLNSLLGGFGLTAPAIRRVAALYAQGELSTAQNVVGSLLTVSMLSALPLTLMIVIFFPTVFVWSQLDAMYQSDAFWATLFVVGSFWLGQAVSVWQAVYQAAQRYDLISILTTIFGVLTGLSGIVVLKWAPSMSAIACTGLVLTASQLVCGAVLVTRLLGRFPLATWQWSEVRPMLGLGGWAYLGSLGGFLFTNLDRLILTTFLGSAAMPYYVVPQRFYLQLHSALSSQSQFLFPMFSALGDSAVLHIGRLEDRLRWYTALISGTAYTGVALVGSLVLGRLIGQEFADQVKLPLVLACVQGFFHAQMIVPYYNSWAVGSGAPNTTAQLLNGTLVAVTAIVLIPRLGYLGASIAQLWIVVISVAHTIWVRSAVTPQLRRWGWLCAYLSPCAMIGAWLLITEVGVRCWSPGLLAYSVLVLLGGVSGLGAVWVIERFVFPSYDRWVTLVRAASLPLGWLRRLVAL